MTRNLAIRPLGPCHNGHNRIDEGLVSVGLSTYYIDCCTENTFVNCIQELIATTSCLLRSTPVLLLWALIHPPELSDLSVHVRRTQHHREFSWISSHRSNGRKSNVRRYSSFLDERSASLFVDCSWIWTIPTGSREKNQAPRGLGKQEANPDHLTQLHPAFGQRSESWQCPEGLWLHLGYCVPHEGDMCIPNIAI